jgi:thiol-disulfide isomerase/thioredoxin
MKRILLIAALLNLCLITSLSAEESIVGIGIALGKDAKTDELKVIKVIEGGPASAAGVKAGLLLRKLGDIDLKGMSVTDAVPLIRGPIGSKVNLELFDPTDNSTKSFQITRAQIVLAAPVKAKRGDTAGPLKIKQWIKGAPMDPKDGKNVYVVEFWATWCGPCRVSIPHLTELQKRFQNKGVVIVGISDEDPAKLKPFVEKMAENMNYVVACDDDYQTSASYMEAFGYNTIPTAFVIDKNGKVVWDGHPMAGLDQAIENALAAGQDK